MPQPINVPKAPKDWKPSGDLAARVASDPRLQRMSRDELYAMSGATARRSEAAKPKADTFTGAFKERARGGILGVALDRAARAMRPK